MPLLPEHFPGITGFEWDAGNSEKNWLRHQVAQFEAEQLFLNRPIVVRRAPEHSGPEVRYFALGRADSGRQLMVAFTLRGSRLRVI